MVFVVILSNLKNYSSSFLFYLFIALLSFLWKREQQRFCCRPPTSDNSGALTLLLLPSPYGNLRP